MRKKEGGKKERRVIERGGRRDVGRAGEIERRWGGMEYGGEWRN